MRDSCWTELYSHWRYLLEALPSPSWLDSGTSFAFWFPVHNTVILTAIIDLWRTVHRSLGVGGRGNWFGRRGSISTHTLICVPPGIKQTRIINCFVAQVTPGWSIKWRWNVECIDKIVAWIMQGLVDLVKINRCTQFRSVYMGCHILDCWVHQFSNSIPWSEGQSLDQVLH